MSHLKVGAEVVSAHNLLPKDGQGSSSSYVELQFDGQKFRTSVKEKDLDPVWNETFYFNVSDPNNLSSLTLDAHVYNFLKGAQSRSSLGKVMISATSFVPYSDAVVMHYPLEKRGIFSRVRGELGLKVFITNDPSIRPSNPLPAMESSTNSYSTQAQILPNFLSNPFSNKKPEARHTFRTLPKTDLPQQQHQLQQANYGIDQMRARPQAPMPMYAGTSSQPLDHAVKETSPFLGGGRIVGGRVMHTNKPASTYDLVEEMRFLYVRVVKAHDLPTMDATGSLDPYVEVRVGNYKGVTRHFEKTKNPEWNAVFAFSEDRMQSKVLEVVLKDKDLIKDDFVGFVRFDIDEIPTRVPPDSPLAPEWYRLADKKGEKLQGELMLAVWFGTQADEAFPDAWHSDAISPIESLSGSTHIRSKVYHSPRLWYVRVNVIEVQDVVLADRTRIPDVYVKAVVGNQLMKTKPVQTRTGSAFWNEDLMFVAAEPFDDHLILTVEDRMGHNKDESLGTVSIPLNSIERRADDHDRPVYSRWYSLHWHRLFDDAETVETSKKEKDHHKFSTRLHLRLCLDGGYHVFDESTQYSSDLRPTAKQLWKTKTIGMLELGILKADALHPAKTRDGKGTSDTYCVAKYGLKWVRTRTVIDSLNPKYNEQYTWEVYDPATVLTIGVFDNNHVGERGVNGHGMGVNGHRDLKVGKVRIRISTLETGRVYTHSYPLLVLHPSGVKKMGELHLAIRFSCTSFANLMYIYSRPLLPKMHYLRPLTMAQLEILRHQAVQIVAARLSRSEPPIRKEVVEYMTDAHSHLWSMRRSKANFYRLMSLFNGLLAITKWFGEVCKWKNPITTVLVHVLYLMLVCFPELILPTVFLYMFLIGLWNYRFRERFPPHMNTRLSFADNVHPDELDEEFDTFPTSRPPDSLRMRYDRLRTVAGRIQTVVGDVATQGERLQALLTWRDPRATTIFVVLCLVAALVFYATPFQVLAGITGFYLMRHPRFRHKLPSAPLNFFRRLPAKTDSML